MLQVATYRALALRNTDVGPRRLGAVEGTGALLVQKFYTLLLYSYNSTTDTDTLGGWALLRAQTLCAACLMTSYPHFSQHCSPAPSRR